MSLHRFVQSPIPSDNAPNQAVRRDLCLGRTRVLSLPTSILRRADGLLLYVLAVLAAARLRARLGRSFIILFQAQILQKTLYVIYANMDFFTGETRIRVRFLLSLPYWLALPRSHLFARASLVHALVPHRPPALLSDLGVQVVPRSQKLPAHRKQLRVARSDVRTDKRALCKQGESEPEVEEPAGLVPSGYRK